MRALLPEPIEDPDVHEWYAGDWVATGGIRVNFVSSVDGAVSADGTSAGLQTPGDNRIFAALRDLADVVLVGSGTALAEKYRRPVPAGDSLAARRRHGLPDALPLAIVSRSGRGLEPGLPIFAAGDAPRPVVLTTASAQLTGLSEVADVIVAGDEDVDYGTVRRELAARGLVRVLCEGGPTIFAQVAGQGEVDELCLSLSPMLSGPGPNRITGGEEWTAGARRLTLHGTLEEAGALFLRYHFER